jgi:hypothetical protein
MLDGNSWRKLDRIAVAIKTDCCRASLRAGPSKTSPSWR